MNFLLLLLLSIFLSADQNEIDCYRRSLCGNRREWEDMPPQAESGSNANYIPWWEWILCIHIDAPPHVQVGLGQVCTDRTYDSATREKVESLVSISLTLCQCSHFVLSTDF